MKRILALLIACVMFASTTLCTYAAGSDQQEGSKSVTAEDIKKMEEEIARLTKQIKSLQNTIKASQQSGKPAAKSSGGGGGAYQQPDVYTKNNAVNYGGNVIAQGGHVEINGGRSNVTFKIAGANPGLLTQANSLAASLGGSLINCVTTSSPGASFSNAKVNFYCSGVQAGDNIAVYQIQGKNWVQLPTAEIRKDHVVVNMTKHGTIAFIRVPVLASVTG
ncbi:MULTISPECIES: hypothetical protein [unclassified Butyrivibrio]|uniref:hypothetical protein n=1 Tax=unclassified Butyrivibrio TaxID=2639466 RepID=UPI0003B7216B|nr:MULTISPECIES: hypothetical protein [unclassified Butyrivibrio]MDC7294841.1 hypothetical protein [Butyrivibrio sp. DSM 10294]